MGTAFVQPEILSRVSASLPGESAFVKQDCYSRNALGAYQEKIQEEGSRYRAFCEQKLNQTLEGASFRQGSCRLPALTDTWSEAHMLKQMLPGSCQPICVKTRQESFKLLETNQRQRRKKEIHTSPFIVEQTQVFLPSQWQIKRRWTQPCSHVEKDSLILRDPWCWPKLFLCSYYLNVYKQNARYKCLLIARTQPKPDVWVRYKLNDQPKNTQRNNINPASQITWFCWNKIAPIEFQKNVTLVLVLPWMFLYLILITFLHVMGVYRCIEAEWYTNLQSIVCLNQRIRLRMSLKFFP